MNKSHLSFVVIVVLLAGNVFFGAQYFSAKKELTGAQAVLNAGTQNDRVLEFMEFFINSVLGADQEIDFDTRLKLETAVRDLGDDEVLEAWKYFADSDSQTAAQQSAVNLLKTLVSKSRVSSE